jgi:predicted lipoprotein with Yx(FWY)xxD motif
VNQRIPLLGAALAASLALAACGGSETPAQNTRDGATVAVQSIGGTDGVLVDAAGKPLYAADVEAGGNIKCVAACVSFWKPLTVASGAPTAASSQVGKLGVVARPDGARQVTAGGKPLYRFAEDGAGQLKGDGFEDQFGGRHFKWSAVLAGGKVGASSGSSGGGDGGRGGYSGY